MVCQLGIPTIFFSLSATDTKWSNLLISLDKLLDNITYTQCDIDKMTWEQKCRLIALAQFLKMGISECLSNDFRHHDLQFIMVIVMLIDSVTFLYVFVSDYIMLVCSIMFRSYEY